MKNRVIAFLSILFVASTFLLSCSDDDNEVQVPTSQVTTSKQFKDIEAANTQINDLVKNVFNTESGVANNGNSNQKLADCITVTSEIVDDNKIIVIDFEDSCELPNGEVISGSIKMSFSVTMDTENNIEISYELENLNYKDITVSGSATILFSFQNDTGNIKFTTNSNFSFAWDDGITATSQTSSEIESFSNNDTGTPINFEFYTLTTGNSLTEFSNSDQYVVEITTPLRNESGCQYIVSGVLVTAENSAVVTLNYGDGECDNIATQTDADGNETTIEL